MDEEILQSLLRLVPAEEALPIINTAIEKYKVEIDELMAVRTFLETKKESGVKSTEAVLKVPIVVDNLLDTGKSNLDTGLVLPYKNMPRVNSPEPFTFEETKTQSEITLSKTEQLIYGSGRGMYGNGKTFRTVLLTLFEDGKPKLLSELRLLYNKKYNRELTINAFSGQVSTQVKKGALRSIIVPESGVLRSSYYGLPEWFSPDGRYQEPYLAKIARFELPI